LCSEVYFSPLGKLTPKLWSFLGIKTLPEKRGQVGDNFFLIGTFFILCRLFTWNSLEEIIDE
jgi:hypothetical protein